MKTRPLNRRIKRSILLILAVCIAVCGTAVAGNRDTALQRAIELYNAGSYTQSIEILKRRLNEAKDSKDKRTEAVVCNNLGNNYSQTGNVVEALAAYQQAAKIAYAAGDLRMSARAEKNIGALYSDGKDFERALQQFEKAEAIARSTGDTPVLADCANNRGVIYEQHNNFGKSLQCYEEAMKL
ncbi:MAG: tetratricopeptide repeat protein [Chitinophagaceae bacterium]|nr:tetratricopeptide repeat protein [Chitinophagaceae bacterium]